MLVCSQEDIHRHRQRNISQDLQDLEYAVQAWSPSLKKDKEVVLAAVTQDGYALKLVSEELKGNQEFANDVERLQAEQDLTSLLSDPSLVKCVRNRANRITSTINNENTTATVMVSHRC